MILVGDCMEKLATLESESVDCCVTSPPYWGLRDYGVDGQLGLEPTPDQYVGHMRMVFEQVRRVLKPQGTLWLNLGDSYAGNGGQYGDEKSTLAGRRQANSQGATRFKKRGLRAKQLVGIPWRVAFALQSDGWYLRQDIIWHKPNPMPESVRDRCTKAHEYIFLFAKSQKYHFDVDAIKEPAKYFGPNGMQKSPYAQGFSRTGERCGKYKSGNKERKQRPGADMLNRGAQAGSIPWEGFTRQKRSVWSVTTKPFKGAHFATFPPDLIEPCILAGCPKGGVVLDPFFGAGTVGLVAKKHERRWIGIELNKEYVQIAERRIGA